VSTADSDRAIDIFDKFLATIEMVQKTKDNKNQPDCFEHGPIISQLDDICKTPRQDC
jgi:hypothetical protein